MRTHPLQQLSDSCSHGNHEYSSTSSRFRLDKYVSKTTDERTCIDNHWCWPSLMHHVSTFLFLEPCHSVTVPTFISILLRCQCFPSCHHYPHCCCQNSGNSPLGLLSSPLPPCNLTPTSHRHQRLTHHRCCCLWT
uniref:Uncharacterized protein n=1 Tax=Zea mays TaxID=4577 RepID=C4IZW5_MAIZE|nr:unknown [Zea mays]